MDIRLTKEGYVLEASDNEFLFYSYTVLSDKAKKSLVEIVRDLSKNLRF